MIGFSGRVDRMVITISWTSDLSLGYSVKVGFLRVKGNGQEGKRGLHIPILLPTLLIKYFCCCNL